MIHNLAEDHVAAAYDALRHHFPDFCGCDLCRADVMVYALNRVPGSYVATLEGSVVTEVNLEREQSRAAIDVVVMDGLRRIARAPRCGRRGAPGVRRT
ncbi:MAG TPA: late competence development ComFB family protein [Gemmatimonadales bacterium]|nr:late competence development ComFB family protein [Gemmatimonadales bacterium]